MPLFPLLTRLLLIASLILNGSGLAWVTDSSMVMPHQGLQASMEATTPHGDASHDADPPCHESLGAEDATAGMQPSDPADATDCCESGTCLHACHQQLAPATLAVAFLAAVFTQSQRASRPLPSAHDAPGLPRLIRPPIA